MEEKFNVGGDDDDRDFSKAKTLVMFCNGMWCGQSPNNIKSLLKMGYPANKIKWYRGGMQDWEVLGLSTVSGKSALSLWQNQIRLKKGRSTRSAFFVLWAGTKRTSWVCYGYANKFHKDAGYR